MEVSVVTTVYNSEKFLPEFIGVTLEGIKRLGINKFELIFVLDGITDNSLSWLLTEKESTPQIRVIELSRNFGHHYAAMAGLNNAKGDKVFLIDCDLEVSPLVIVDFFNLLIRTESDVVYGVQSKRKGAWAERVLGGIFWKMFNLLSDTRVPENIVTERLMSASYVNALCSMQDKNVFMAGLMYWVGFKQTKLEVTKTLRKGSSTYGIGRRIDLLVQAVTSFSEKPLTILFKFGITITLLAMVFGVYQLVLKLVKPDTILLGYASLMILLVFTLGVLTAAIGLLGIYISKLFIETKDRPRYIIKKTY